MVSLPTHICVTRPQWVNTLIIVANECLFRYNRTCHARPGGRLNIKMSSIMGISRPSFSLTRESHTWERRSLYREAPLVDITRTAVLVSYNVVKLLQRIWWAGTCRFYVACCRIHLRSLNMKLIDRYQDILYMMALAMAARRFVPLFIL